MALTAREVVFYIRARNQASGAITRAARDIASLRSLNGGANAAAKRALVQQQALEAKLTKMMQQRLSLAAKLNAAQVRADTLAKRSLAMGTGRNSVAVQRAQQNIIGHQAALRMAQTSASRLDRIAAKGKAFGGYTVEEIATRAEAANLTVTKLIAQEETLQRILKETTAASIAQAQAVAAEAEVAANAVNKLKLEEDTLRASIRETIGEIRLQREEVAMLGKAIPVERMQSYVNAVRQAGRTMRMTGEIGLAGAGVAAVTAARFRSESTLAATQMRQPGQSYANTAAHSTAISNQVLKLMQQFPASAQDMNDSFYQIFSGTNIQNLGKATSMLKIFNEMAVAGGTDLKTMTDAGISLYNNFPDEFKNMTDAANAFFATVRYGRMNAEQFAGSLSRVLPIAKEAGLHFTDVADAMALVTRQTGGARTGYDATGLARLIQMLGNKDVVAGLAKFGINVKASTGAMRPLLDIITDIQKKFVATGQIKPGPDMLNFFKYISAQGSGGKGLSGTIQGGRIFSYLINQLKEYTIVSGQVNRDNGEMEKSFIAMNKSPGVQWDRFVNTLHALVYEIGTAAIPAFMEMGKPIVKIIKWFNGLSSGTKSLIGNFVVFGSVGLVATGALLGLAASLGRMLLMFQAIKLMGGLKVILGLGAGEAGAISPLTAAILAIVAALAILLPVLAKHPHAMNGITSALGGMAHIFKVATLTIIGMMALRLGTWFVGLAAKAAIANTELEGVALWAGRLRALGPIVLTVLIVDQFLKPSAKKFYDKHGFLKSTVGHVPLIGDAMGSGGEFGTEFGNWFNKKVAQHYDVGHINEINAAKKPMAPAIRDGFDAMNTLQSILNNPNIDSTTKMLARGAFNAKDYKSLSQIAYRARKTLVQTGKAAPTKAELYGPVKPDHVLTRTFMQELEGLAKLQKVYDKTHSLKDWVKFQKGMVAIGKDYPDKMYQSYVSEYLSKVESANKKSLSSTKKTAADYAAQLSTMYSNIMSTYQSFLSQNQSNYGQLFQGPFMQSANEQTFLSFNNNKPRPADLLKDAHAQLFQFNRFNHAVGHLAKKGAPQSLVDQLNAAGPSAMNDIAALNRLSPKQLNDYISTWNKGQAAIKANTMKQLNNQLSIYRKFGKNVAQAIIAGISSEDPKLEDKLKAVIDRMFPDLVNKAKKANKTVPHGTKGSLAPHTTVNHHHFSPTINNPTDESSHTALKRSFFHMKQHTWY